MTAMPTIATTANAAILAIQGPLSFIGVPPWNGNVGRHSKYTQTHGLSRGGPVTAPVMDGPSSLCGHAPPGVPTMTRVTEPVPASHPPESEAG
jgi:hypothetical protein